MPHSQSVRQKPVDVISRFLSFVLTVLTTALTRTVLTQTVLKPTVLTQTPRTLRASSQECDDVLKKHKDMLKAIYDAHRVRDKYSGGAVLTQVELS
jgi:hypothetical protein